MGTNSAIVADCDAAVEASKIAVAAGDFAASKTALAAANRAIADFQTAQRPQIAYHEAGHVVAYHLVFGRAVESASINRIGISVGRTVPKSGMATVIAGEYAAILIAGRVAQEKYLTHAGLPVDKLELDDTARHDVEEIREVHDRLSGCRLDMFLEIATTKAAALLEANWPAVSRIAADLLEHGTLSGAQVEAAYRREAR